MSTIDEDALAIERELGIEGDDYDDDETGYVDDIGDDDDDYDDDIFGDDDDDDDDIEGDDDDDVGRRRRRRRRRRRSRRSRSRRRRSRPRSGQRRIRVRAPGNVGNARLWHLPCTADLTLVAAATGTLTFTPNRNISIVDLILGVYTAAAITRAATYPEAISITNITVQGRTQFPGAGNVPLAAFEWQSTKRYGVLQWENCMAAQSVIVSFTNRDAATTHIVTGCLVVQTVW